MTDLFLAIAGSEADLEIEGGDLRLDETLRSPILVSLFSDARLGPDEEIPDGSTDRRGWWGTSPVDPFGSLLWTLQRTKITDETLVRFQEAILTALDWLVREGIAQDIAVEVERSPRVINEIVATVQVVRGDATRWPQIWEGILDEQVVVGGVRVLVLAN